MRMILMAGMLMGLAGCGEVPPSGAAPEDDLCGASSLQDRLGQPAGDFDFGPEARILTEDSAVTLDFRLDRLNVVTDDAGVILEIACD